MRASSSMKEILQTKTRSSLETDKDFILSVAYMKPCHSYRRLHTWYPWLKQKRRKSILLHKVKWKRQSDWLMPLKETQYLVEEPKLAFNTSFVPIFWTAACLWGQRASLPSSVWLWGLSLKDTLPLMPWGRIIPSVKSLASRTYM